MLRFIGQVLVSVLTWWLVSMAVGLGLIFLGALVLPATDQHPPLDKVVAYIGLFLIFAGPATLTAIVGYSAAKSSRRGPLMSIVVGVVVGISLFLPHKHPPPAASWYIPLQQSLAIVAGGAVGGVLYHIIHKRACVTTDRESAA